jgi:uncharacterized protein YydD (DUF2326 family)
MKLSKLYTNQPDLFSPVRFNTGLCVVLAEIRLAQNRDEDTHNLGKSILGRLIDFGMLAGRDPQFFLFKHEDLFEEFVFFLEIELPDASYVTVRRGVKEATKISFKRHQHRYQDFTGLTTVEWDHLDLPFDRAREILDGLLDWSAIKPWQYRKGLGYLVRLQDDYRNVFQLGRHKSKHADWKPFLAHILGFDSKLLTDYYEKEDELSKIQATEKTIKDELGGSVEDGSKIEGILLLKQQAVDKKQSFLDAFDFRSDDKERTKRLVEEIDEKIAALNVERYSLSKNRKKITASLEESQILFNPEEAAGLFREAGVFFGGQLKRDFEQLIDFNKAITEERRQYLDEERQEIDARLKQVNAELNAMGKKRSEALSFLSETDIFAKYKQLTGDLVAIKADITALERQRTHLHRLQGLRAEIRSLTEQRAHLQTQIEADVEKQNSDSLSMFSKIRLFFSEIVENVIDRKALLSVSPNKEGHLEFKAEILDETGNATSADLGHTYRKLLCIAFDLAVLRAHLEDRFPRFVYHDGAFESLDDRKKENLLMVIRQYADLGLQPIITLIDCDQPPRTADEPAVFDNEEIVLLLHDEGADGRLFKTDAW